uniref:Ovule protein n=1 Tax=Anisakis simplex TaxID=6269 RepID=A0A0M3JG82_ANISI
LFHTESSKCLLESTGFENHSNENLLYSTNQGNNMAHGCNGDVMKHQ